MYGESPTRIMEKEARPPPEIKFKKPEKSDFEIRLETASLKVLASPIGTGICASKRYATIMPKTIAIRFNMSLFFRDLKIVLKCIRTSLVFTYI